MPEVMIKKLGPFNKENNQELICESCNKYKKEEELSFMILSFMHPEEEGKVVGVTLNICKACIDNFITNAPMNRVRDIFGGEGD